MKIKIGYFIIASPLQLICGINAKKEYCIDKAVFLIFQTDRLDQMTSTAERMGLEYDVITTDNSKGCFKKAIFEALKGGTNSADYIFVGDYRDLLFILKGVSLTKGKCKLVYLDDGAATITYFSGKEIISKKVKFQRFITRIVLLLRRITDFEYFTIYDVYAPGKKIRNNKLDVLVNTTCNHKEGIYFIGTNTLAFCEFFEIEKIKYLRIIQALLSDIINRFPNERYFYIAHGKDKSEDIIHICKSVGFDYIRPNECIELYLLNQLIIPIYAAGFCSSALYNIKKMFSTSTVENYVILGNNLKVGETTKEIESIYKKIGINTFNISDWHERIL